MKIKVKCTGRAENDNKEGKGIWTYAFSVIANHGEVIETTVIFKLDSTKPLHYKRGDILDLELKPHSGIQLVTGLGNSMDI